MTDVERMQENLKSAVALIEQGRTVHQPDCACAYAPTGDYFLTWVSGGIKNEGASVGVWCTSPETALTWMLKHIMNYKSKHPGIVYWRKRPTINVENFLKPVQSASPLALNQETTMAVYPLYFAWCRMVISDRPHMTKEEEEKFNQDKIDVREMERRVKGGMTLGQPSKDAHRSTSQSDEGRSNGKLEGN